jgi:hypothetical protein
MAQAHTQQATTNTQVTNNGNSNTSTKREAKPPTAIEAITKISKILDQLSPSDRKRVLAFVNESNESGE